MFHYQKKMQTRRETVLSSLIRQQGNSASLGVLVNNKTQYIYLEKIKMWTNTLGDDVLCI